MCRDTQPACIMYRYSRNDEFIEHTVKREDLRSEEKSGLNVRTLNCLEKEIGLFTG